MKFYGVNIHMKPLQQYFHTILFIEYVVLTFESADEILWSYHSNATSLTELLHNSIFFYDLCELLFFGYQLRVK